jgi:hypothetical protein
MIDVMDAQLMVFPFLVIYARPLSKLSLLKAVNVEKCVGDPRFGGAWSVTHLKPVQCPQSIGAPRYPSFYISVQGWLLRRMILPINIS